MHRALVKQGEDPVPRGKVGLGQEHVQLIHSPEGRAEHRQRSQQSGGSLGVGILFRWLPFLVVFS